MLVVDDEAAVLRVLQRLVQFLGYRATAYGSGAEALAALRTAPEGFHAVVTDDTMPEMSGLDLAAHVRALRPDLPVVLGTGFAEGIDARVVAERGLQGLVTKPYDTRTLGEVLKRVCCGRTSAARRLA